MIAPATGIKRRFYAPFAKHLSQNGFGVLTFDNRGIGDSLKGKIRGSNASLQQWGEQDMPAILESLKDHFPATKYHLVGHSAGGQLVGLMPNCEELTSMFNFACSSGQLKNMKMPFQFSAFFFMNVYIPLNNILFGHSKTNLVGMGEALPKKVAAEWSEWCNGQGYVKTAFDKSITRHWYNELDIPSLWVNAIDDDIANNENVDDMASVFTKLQVEKMSLVPSDHGLKEIGHMKFFSKGNQQLWSIAIDWLNKQS